MIWSFSARSSSIPDLRVRDLAAIVDAVRDAETFVVIDGYHGFMAVPTDLSPVAGRAFYLAGGYKYAMAGEGACFLHCPPELWSAAARHGMVCRILGAGERRRRRPYATDGSRFLGATFDVTALYRFNAVQDWLAREQLSVAGMLAQVREHRAALPLRTGRRSTRLSPRATCSCRTRAAADAFSPCARHRPAAIATRLAAKNIIVDHRADRLRIGFGIYHDLDDAVRLAEAVAE